MSGEIVDLSRRTEHPDLAVEVLVIGSGPGGATAARVLAEAGREVVLLDEGGDYTGLDLTQRDGAMFDQLYAERGGRMTSDLSIAILQGRVLGGGAVINSCDVVPFPDGVLEHWQKKYGLGELSPSTLAPYQKRALDDLSANFIQEAQLNEANRRLRAGAEKLGLRGYVMRHNRVGCAGLGTCMLGCPVNAKRNPRMVAIPRALAAGARVFIRGRALVLEDARAELKTVRVVALDGRGYHPRYLFQIRAKRVIVAANSIGSAELLLRSGVGNELVGRHLSLQPQIPVVAIFDQPIRAYDGIPQAYAVTEHENEHHPEHGLWGFRVEAQFATPGNVASLLPLVGPLGKDTMALYDRMAAALVLVPDEPTGRVRVGESPGRPIVEYRHAESHKQRLREGIAVAARIYFAAGARRVMVPTVPPLVFDREADVARAHSLRLEPATASMVSAHQQGAVRFSPSARTGAADPDGQVYGTRGVYVFDTSGFPTTASSHPMAPIITMSHYLSAKLLSRL